MKKKLIEVALPLDAINKESLQRKQKAPKGFPTTFHKWWAQRPIAACRAVIFASLIDDPSGRPDKFPTEEEQNVERDRLFRLIEDLIKWDNSNDKNILARAWKEILESTDGDPPPLYDPFCGGGSIPIEGQRLGLETYASDLNPVSVLINKAMIEIPAKFSNQPPINPTSRKQKGIVKGGWGNAKGIAEDVRYYSYWIRHEAERQIGPLYPNMEITSDLTKERPDLRPLVGQKLPVVAYLWARTVKSSNPAFSKIDVPLATTFILSSKGGRRVYVEPIIDHESYHFEVRVGDPKDYDLTNNGTKISRGSNFRCIMSGIPMNPDYIKAEGMAGRMGTRLMAIVVEGGKGRIYLSPTQEMETLAKKIQTSWEPDEEISNDRRSMFTPLYGLTHFRDLFTSRQLVALTTFSDLVLEARRKAKEDAIATGMTDDGISLEEGGNGATAYADAIAIYLACAVDRMAYYGSTLTTWLPKDNALRDSMPRQGISMTWDFAECNPLGKSSGDITTCSNVVSNYLDLAYMRQSAKVFQQDARKINNSDMQFLFSTDPPYFDNIGYADLSEYFYIWLRRSMKTTLPRLFATLSVPKNEELVANPYRHGSKEAAELFFLEGMTEVMKRLAEKAHPSYPITIYYAFKQSETDDEEGTSSTGWETFLEAVIQAGLSVCGTWPMRTEGAGRLTARDTNALASSIILVCRPRSKDAETVTRRDFLNVLKAELPTALAQLQRVNTAPVDLAQAVIGPGMAVYSRYAKVLDIEGKEVSVQEALLHINQTLDECLAEQEGDFDADSRWALAWFEQYGFEPGEYGVAETLSKAKNTSVQGMVDAGILVSKSGKVKLLRPEELPLDWDPNSGARLTVWEIVHQLIHILQASGESAVSELMAKLGNKADTTRELSYRLYTQCERKKRAKEALMYNSLVQSLPEIIRLAKGEQVLPKGQTILFEEN